MEIRTCDVHRLIDNDAAPRECEYCPRCQAWICKEDLHRWDRRALAMVKMWGNQFGPTSDWRRNVTQPVGGCGTCGKK